MGEHKRERIPKSSIVRRDEIKYEKYGITLLAAQLANDDAIDDYWLVTNPASIDYFGHVVTLIIDANQNKYALFVETKAQKAKTMRFVTDPNTEHDNEKYDIPLSEYLQSYNKIINLDVSDELKDRLQDIPPENFYFCLFTNMPRNITMQKKNKELINVKLNMKNNDGNILNCFGSYAQCPRSGTFPERYGNFLEHFYIFAEQPNIQRVYKELQEHIGKSTESTISNLCDVIDSCMKEDEYCLPLTKIVFFEKCLEAQLSEIFLF